MDRNLLEKIVVNSLKYNSDELRHFDEIYFCLFNQKDLDMARSNRFRDFKNIETFKEYNLLTSDLNIFLDYVTTAHESNSGMIYGCIGILGDTYFLISFRFKVNGNGTIRRSNKLIIAPHFRFSSKWLTEYYVKYNGKIRVSDVALKVKLGDFLNNGEN